MNFKEYLRTNIVVFDGAMGTNLQLQNLSPEDFGGKEFEGCNDYLTLTNPKAVEKVHRAFLEAGCNVIETNTFGANRIVLQEYNLGELSYELNLKSAQLAKNIIKDYIDKPRFVAGSIGPSTKLPSLGHISFIEMEEIYYEQVSGLIEGGVDLLICETSQDMLQSKTVAHAIQRYFEKHNTQLPVIFSFTIERNGTMLLGTDISAILTTFEPFDFIDVIGLNCATGPKEMSESIHYLSQNSPKYILVMPNAGMPENINGKPVYNLTPEELAKWMMHYVNDLGINAVGGCCGTRPEHIKALADAFTYTKPCERKFEFVPSVSSSFSSVPLRIEPAPILVGEKCNANGSKKFRELLANDDYESILETGKEQIKEGAHILDVCVAYVGRDEIKDIQEVIFRFNTNITIPIMIDSTELKSIEKGLQLYAGRAIINSVNLEDGEDRVIKVFELCKKYGAAVIALTIDEKGMAKTLDKKIEITDRIFDLAIKCGLKPKDLIFDTLTFTLGSGDEELKTAGLESIKAIKIIKEKHPGINTILGVSNISFGLNPKSRNILNSVFLHYSIEYGLDLAIVNAQKIIPLYKIDATELALCKNLIFNEGENNPLLNLINYFKDKLENVVEKEIQELPIEENLKSKIIDGSKTNLENLLDEALKKYTPLEIINNILLGGMAVVGELFGSGKMQLPFVLQSAEVMKFAVSYLEKFMDKALLQIKKGKMIIATVKGDVHDIGKNLVEIILTNNGFEVVNLGIKCPVEKMVDSFLESGADAIGMSGLLVKSTLIMKENLEILNERGINVPVILGGAALTRKYVEGELSEIYEGNVFYAKDAFDGLNLMNKLSDDKLSEHKNTSIKKKNVEIQNNEKRSSFNLEPSKSIPQPPFWGVRKIEDIPLNEIFNFINENALIRGQWQIKKKNLSDNEYNKLLNLEIYPVLDKLKKKCIDEKLLVPKVVYGYFKCQSENDDLIIYNEDLLEIKRFNFPRQKNDRKLCISDFFKSKSSCEYDTISGFFVTVGKRASEYAKELYDKNLYSDYLYFHGLSVECAEALAEYTHRLIRKELKIDSSDSSDIKGLFNQKYQGTRYSFGYPACPNLEDQLKLSDLLNPKEIGIEITDEFQLVPEQSVSAIVAHHHQAKYFSV